MVSSNSGSLCKALLSGVRVPGSGSSSQSARGRCTMRLREGRTSQGGRRTPLGPAVHTIKRDDPAHVPAGTSRQRSQANAFARCGLSCHAGGPVEELAGPQHRVHHDRELSATATAARLKPIRSLSLSPHVRRDPHLTKEPDLGELRQAIGISFVGGHVQGCLSMARIDADRRQPFRCQRMKEPH